MAQYKVIYRDDNPGWQPGCPILIEVIQVSRNTETAQCFLQIKVRNISDETIDKLNMSFDVRSPQGGIEKASFEFLDAGIRPGAEFKPQAKPLEAKEVSHIDGRVVGAGSQSTFAAMKPLPEAKPLSLSKHAKEERDAVIRKEGVNPSGLTGQASDHGSWWQCSCGAVNLGRKVCLSCGASKTKALAWNDTEGFEKLAEEHLAAKLESAKEAQ